MVRVSRNDDVVRLTFDRPDARNALTPAAANELADTLEEVTEGDPRALVITGEGAAFCAGGDLQAMQERDETPAECFERMQETANRVIETIMTAQFPVIAAVNGDAVGAGTNIAAACDFVYATESARFGEVFINVGLIPDCGGTFLIPELVGLRTAVELAMTGRIFNSSEAIEMGLITKVVPDGELETAVNELLDDLAKKPTETLGLTKRAIYGNLGRQLDDALEREAMIQSQAAGTDSHAEGVAAVLEDRPPSFE